MTGAGVWNLQQCDFRKNSLLRHGTQEPPRKHDIFALADACP